MAIPFIAADVLIDWLCLLDEVGKVCVHTVTWTQFIATIRLICYLNKRVRKLACILPLQAETMWPN